MATSRGIDVSAYQGTQDWAAHKKGGLTFAFAKASEGQKTHDARFATHIKGIIAAGLVPGAYHFAWPNQSATAEAANYISAVKPYATAGFTHWLDLERMSDGRNYKGRTAAQIKAFAVAWIAAVEHAFPGQRVGVYTSASDIAAGHVPAGVPLWYPAYPWGAAAYAKAEAATQPRPSGKAPLIWQFTSTPMDRSICYLSAAQLRDWAAGTDTTPEEHVSMTNAQQESMIANTTRIGSLTEKNGKGQAEIHGAGYYLAHIEQDTTQLKAQVAALTKAVATLTKAVAALAPKS